MFRWLRGQGAGAAEVADMRSRIPPALWRQVLATHPFLSRLTEPERQALLERTAWLLASKHINGARGLELDDAMRLSIAAQAALPVLNLDPRLYEGWNEIIVYPEGFSVPRSRTDEIGIVHEYLEEAAGEAWEGGPVILSWTSQAPGDATWPEDNAVPGQAFNVVIHEFAHKLDLATGDADGMPALGTHPDLPPRRWRRILEDSLDRFAAALDAVEDAIPHDVDPESPEADAWYAQLPLDPYAATDEAEFFAVSSEQFFVDPAPLAEALPDWYSLLQAYYRQDTLARFA